MPDTYSHQGPECPYCGRQYVADDAFYYDEMKFTEMDCDNCGKKFKVSVHISSSWTCEEIKIDGQESCNDDVPQHGER